MIASFDLLLEYLSPLGVSRVIRGGGDGPLNGLAAYGPDTDLCPDVIYVGRASQLSGDCAGLTLALVEDAPCDLTAARVILLEPQVTVEAIRREVGQFVSDCINYYRGANRVMSAGLQGTLQDVINAAAAELDAQLTVADLLLCPLVYASDETFHDPDWEAMEAKGLVPPLPWMSDLGRQEKLGSSNGNPVYKWKGGLLVELGRRGRKLGYLSLVGEEESLRGKRHRELVNVLSGVLASELESKVGHTAVNSVFEHYLVALIENRFNSDWEAQQLTEDTGLQPEGFYTLVLVDISKYSVRQRSLHAFRIALEQSLHVTRSTIYGDRLVLLLSAPSEPAAQQRDYTALAEQLERGGVYASVSRTFTSLWELTNNYNGANEILKQSFCAPEGVRVLSAENMGITFVVDALLRIEKPTDLIDPRVRALLRYDKANGTSYIDTLLIYLRNSRKPASTCKMLHIHRNTLDYRLQKIVDLVGIDWNDGDLCFRIYLSLNVLHYCRLVDQQEPYIDV